MYSILFKYFNIFFIIIIFLNSQLHEVFIFTTLEKVKIATRAALFE